MALPEDFSKIYGSTATGGLTPISNVDYAKGWEFVGSNPPTKNDFSYLQNLSDLKSQWLYSNKLQRTDPFGDIKSDGAAAVAAALSNLGLGTAAKRNVDAGVLNGIPDMSFFRASIAPNGWFKYPCIDQYNNQRTLIIQFATIRTDGATDKGYQLPFAFPNAGLFATGNRATSGYNAAMNVRIVNASTVSIQNWAPSGAIEDCCVIAVGW